MIVEGENKLYQENVVEEADEMPEHPISQDIVRMIKCQMIPSSRMRSKPDRFGFICSKYIQNDIEKSTLEKAPKVTDQQEQEKDVKKKLQGFEDSSAHLI